MSVVDGQRETCRLVSHKSVQRPVFWNQTASFYRESLIKSPQHGKKYESKICNIFKFQQY